MDSAITIPGRKQFGEEEIEVSPVSSSLVVSFAFSFSFSFAIEPCFRHRIDVYLRRIVGITLLAAPSLVGRRLPTKSHLKFQQ